jgi:NADH dehydrogenase (ubiquinone) 1 beta subcomplex subunit 3
MFPGFGIAVVAFTAYVIYDDYIAPKPAHGHGHGHVEGHH